MPSVMKDLVVLHHSFPRWFCSPSLPVRTAAIRLKKPCRRRRACSSTNARAATLCSGPNAVTAVYFAPMGAFHALRFRLKRDSCVAIKRTMSAQQLSQRSDHLIRRRKVTCLRDSPTPPGEAKMQTRGQSGIVPPSGGSMQSRDAEQRSSTIFFGSQSSQMAY